MEKILLASNNAHKAREIAQILGSERFEVLTLADCGLVSDPEESATTFYGNAHIKAQAAHELKPDMAVLADDSGLEVDALDGAPGVWSARYAGEHATDADNNAKLLAALEEVPAGQRSARFVCELVYIMPDDQEIHVRGTIEGAIDFHKHGEGGFGYDPLFLPDCFGDGRTLAEATADEKNAVSHRGNAVRLLKEALVG